MRRCQITIALLAVSLLVATVNAVAHPLGNFSVNQYSALRVDEKEIEVRYIVDMAEIPTFQEMQETGLVPEVGDASARRYLLRQVETLGDGLLLQVNGRKIALRAQSREIVFPEGAAGLPTMKIAAVYKGKLEVPAAASHEVFYRDSNFPGRAGWKEVIAFGAEDTRIIESSTPPFDRSAELSNYPTDLLNSPPRVLEARLTFAPGRVAPANHDSERSPSPILEFGANNNDSNKPNLRGATDIGSATRTMKANALVGAPKPEAKPLDGGTTPLSDSLQPNKQATPKNSFTELIAAKRFDWRMISFAFLIAAVLGAFHALEPGHGKTLVAAYLVGSRGTMKHALMLGLIVTAAHTSAVYLLGGVTLYASRYIMPERLYPWLALLSGLMITGLGIGLFFQRYFGKAGQTGQTAHHHHHDRQHHHDHGHSHRSGNAHHHHELTQEVSVRQLLALGISGGIVPCPAALVVLLSAASMQRIGFGLLLIVSFSLGLAAVLIGIGLLMVYARRFMVRFQGNGQLTTRWLPLTSSAFIMMFGVALTWQALASSGFLYF